jgi:hypothetical protein
MTGYISMAYFSILFGPQTVVIVLIEIYTLVSFERLKSLFQPGFT